MYKFLQLICENTRLKTVLHVWAFFNLSNKKTYVLSDPSFCGEQDSFFMENYPQEVYLGSRKV